MPAKRELSNQRFGALVVIGEVGRDLHGAGLWRCVCDCGRATIVRSGSLIQGSTKSCGCGVAIAARSRATVHGGSKSALYQRWQAMKARCGNPRNAAYGNYGGRGICVCARWQSFPAFARDMGPTFTDNMEIERKDNNGNYEPANCIWVNHSTNNRNKRTNHQVTINGESKILIEWGEIAGLKPNTILTRIRRGWPQEMLLSDLVEVGHGKDRTSCARPAAHGRSRRSK